MIAKRKHNICKKYKSVEYKRGRMYDNGLKRCTLCAVYFKTDELRCPCCNTRLRISRRDKPSTMKRLHEPDTRIRVA